MYLPTANLGVGALFGSEMVGGVVVVVVMVVRGDGEKWWMGGWGGGMDMVDYDRYGNK